MTVVDRANERVRQGLTHRVWWVRVLCIVAVCIVAGAPIGAVLGLLGWMYGSAALLAVAVGYLILRSTLVGLLSIIAIITLLPFAAVPIDIGFSPTFLDLALAGLYFVWVSRLLARIDTQFVTTPTTLPLLLFAMLAVVSYIRGLEHGALTANNLRHFAEILLSLLLFIVVTNTVRCRERLQIAVTALMVGGAIAALIGVILYLLPSHLTVQALSMLRVVRYPMGLDVLRYIEDNPELPLRATSTSVDPNVLGGMLIFTTTMTASMALARKPLLPRPLLFGMLAVMLMCMIMTYSRGSLAGLVAALGLLALLRYRKLFWIGIVAFVLLLLLPQTQAYVSHFIEGIQGQDLATQMRFGEYKDALILIGRYPWLGVGFSGTPDIDTYLGVSNVYLLIAEQMGIVGLAVFLMAIASYGFYFWGTREALHGDDDLEPIALGVTLAIFGGLVGGLLDHYLFNLVFPHASSLLWLSIGLGAVSIKLATDPQSVPPQESVWLG
ncbi:MAG: O-antigen ligase family protein [Anaerolineae bacterium]